MALIDNLVSYWKLDEASGNRADSHGSNTLTENNTVGSAAGKIGNAADFEDATSGYLSHTDNTDLSCGDVDYTFSFWLNAETLNGSFGFPVVFSKGGTGDRDYALYFNVGKPSFESAGQLIEWGSALSTGTWYHIICWHDATANEIGISVNDGTPATRGDGTAVDSTGDFQLGASVSQGLYWDGLIDEFGFWKRVLTSGERTQLYNSGSGLAYPFSGGGTAVPVFFHHLMSQG